MIVSVACPHCDKSYRVEDKSLGRARQCRSCGEQFCLEQSAADTRRSQAEVETDGKSRDADRGAAPEKLGRFEIRFVLGAGAFGTVYQAWDPVLDREIALKVPHAGLLADEENKQRYLREPKAAGRLRHPNIVPVFEAGFEGEALYIASAFIEGRTLEEAIRDTSAVDFRAVGSVIIQLAEALDYAHGKQVVHRDIKPANLMIDSDGDALIMDFGLAQIQEAADRMSQDGTVLGTPAYMPPEQARGALDKVGPLSDQYSLGVVLYEMLTGERPFSGPPELVISLVINQEPERPSSHNAAIPRDLETICLKAMAKDSAKRYADCHHLAEDIQRWLEDQPIKARRASAAERLVRWCRRNPAIAGLAGLSAALLLLVTVVSAVGFASTSAALSEAEIQREEAKTKQAEAERQRTLAELQSAEAARQQAIAKSESEKAHRLQKIADVKSKDALRQSQVAQQESERAKDESRRANRNFYAAQMALAQRDSEDGHVSIVRERLEQTLPKYTGNNDFRGFEWHYWNRFSRRFEHLTLEGHRFDVKCVAFSPDGAWIASGGGAGGLGEVKVWSAHNGQVVFELNGHNRFVNCVTFSPDGTRIASASGDGTVKVWDATTGKEKRTIKRHTGNVVSLSFSPDGSRIASASSDHTVKVWDADSGRERLALQGHRFGVNSVAFSPDGLRLASAGATSGNHGEVKVWRVRDGQELLALHGHSKTVNCVVFSPDGTRIASASADTTLKVWDATTGTNLFTIDGNSLPVNSVSFSPDGMRLASSTGALDLPEMRLGDVKVRLGEVKVWDAATGQIVRTLVGHNHVVNCAAFSPDGTRLVSASYDKTVKVWDVSPNVLRGHVHTVTDVAFSPDGTRIVSGSRSTYGPLVGVDVRVWNAVTGHETLSFEGHTTGVNAVVFSPDGSRIASAGSNGDNTIKVWDASTGKELLELNGHVRGVNGVAFSPDGAWIASAGGYRDDTVKVWDVATGREKLTLRGHKGGVTCVAFSPDGIRLASSSHDTTVKLWDATTGQETLTLHGHTDAINGVAFSPDGSRIASASADETVRVWDADRGEQTLALHGHTGDVNSVTFSPDGTRIASAGADETVKLWYASTGHELLSLHGHAEGVSSVAFSPDGMRLASASHDKTVKLWKATTLDVVPAEQSPASTISVE